jgi:predicted nuclease of predicted toxin-antitoxin system
VKFLIDAQLPARLAEFLNRAWHDALHTIGLPDGNRSTDSQIAQHADTENRVVVTKDQDFRDGHLLGRSPRKLLVVATGNTTNDALLSLFELHLDAAGDRNRPAEIVLEVGPHVPPHTTYTFPPGSCRVGLDVCRGRELVPRLLPVARVVAMWRYRKTPAAPAV